MIAPSFSFPSLVSRVASRALPFFSLPFSITPRPACSRRSLAVTDLAEVPEPEHASHLGAVALSKGAERKAEGRKIRISLSRYPRQSSSADEDPYDDA